jgi:hypothetical protein
VLHLVTDVVPVITQDRRVVGRVAVKLERARVVHRGRTPDPQHRSRRHQKHGHDQKAAPPPAPPRASARVISSSFKARRRYRSGRPVAGSKLPVLRHLRAPNL